MEFPNNKQGQMAAQMGGGGYAAMQPYAAMGMGPQFGVTPEMMQGYNAEMMQVRCRAGEQGPGSNGCRAGGAGPTPPPALTPLPAPRTCRWRCL